MMQIKLELYAEGSAEGQQAVLIVGKSVGSIINNRMIEPKQCPKCYTLHAKPGKFCSRQCANSRIWTDDINARRQISNQKSGLAFWSDSPRANEIRLSRKRISKCVICDTETQNRRKTCSSQCLLLLRPPSSSKKKRPIQKLLSNASYHNDVIQTIFPTHGTPGRSATYEGEIERRRKISIKAKQRNGGYRRGSGRGRKGWYKGMFCDSSWELAFVLWCELHNKDIERNKYTFEYTWQDKIRKYLPDFIVDKQFIEIKGWLSPQNQAKIDQFPHDKHKLVVYTEATMKSIFLEIYKVYGKNFTRLYESENEPDKRTGTVLKTVGTPEGSAGQD